jgi:Galactosyltransferase
LIKNPSYVFRFDFAPEAAKWGQVCFQLSDHDIPLLIELRSDVEVLIVNQLKNGVWGSEIHFDLGSDPFLECVVRHGEDGPASQVLVGVGDTLVPVPWLNFQDLSTLTLKVQGAASTHDNPIMPRRAETSWRYAVQSSGYPAPLRGLDDPGRKGPLQSGLTFLIRAKNEDHIVDQCIRSIRGVGDAIVFCDNNSSDRTGAIVERLKREVFELQSFPYMLDVAKAGLEHAIEVTGGGSNTLGHFYNWCLSHVVTSNFIKWDADYIALRHNLKEMIDTFDLQHRGDNFALWFSGLEVYTDGNLYWVDSRSRHSEFRVFSKLHGARWVNIIPWEEIDQRILFRAQKLVYRKPVYCELFRLDSVEFRDRGEFLEDVRDAERIEYIREFKETGRVPEYFVPVSGLSDPILETMQLSPNELDLADFFERRFRSCPQVSSRDGRRRIELGVEPQHDFGIFIVSCAKNEARRAAIRSTWMKDAEALGLSIYFIIGRHGRPSQIEGDTIYVDAPDTYEFLSSKLLAAVEFFLTKLNLSYFFKIDDDCVCDVFSLLSVPLQSYDYIGGGLAGGAGSFIDWHLGKCSNRQLDHVVFQRNPQTFWYGGQFSYFLSHYACNILVKNRQEVCESLYEDYIVGETLAKAGIPVAPIIECYRGVKAEHDWKSISPVVVADIADAAAMLDVYAALVPAGRLDAERQRSLKDFKLNFDWMDFEDVRRRIVDQFDTSDESPGPSDETNLLMPDDHIPATSHDADGSENKVPVASVGSDEDGGEYASVDGRPPSTDEKPANRVAPQT